MTEQTRIPRRTIARGVAWSTPVVAVAVAAPMASASGEPVVIDFDKSTGCKIPGSSQGGLCYVKGYVLFATIINTTAQSATVTINSMTVGGVPNCVVGVSDIDTSCGTTFAGKTFTIGAGATRKVAIFSNASTDSSSTTISVNFTYNVGGGPVNTDQDTDADVGGSPWPNANGGSCTRPGTCAGIQPPTACGSGC